MKLPKVFAVLINFNDYEDILRAVSDLTADPQFNGVVVVDNGSTDGSLEKIRKINNPKLFLVENGVNLGFAKAANRGIKKALSLGADYVMPLNPDLIFYPGFVGKLLKNSSDLTQMALKFKRNGQWVYDFGGKINWVIGRTYHLENDRPVPPEPKRAADFVSGGATLVSREVYEKAGLFDERYFMYFEDAEHSLRAQKMGFSISVDPNVIIEHKLEIARQTKNINKMKFNLRSNLQFILQCLPWYFKPSALVYWILLDLKITFGV